MATEAVSQGEAIRRRIAILLALLAGLMATFFFMDTGNPSVSRRALERLELQHALRERLRAGDPRAILSLADALKNEPNCNLWQDLCTKHIELPYGLRKNEYAVWLIGNQSRLRFDHQEIRFQIPR